MYLPVAVYQIIFQARLKTPPGWSDVPQNDQFCEEHSCVRWDADEVGYSYTSDSLFVTTRIKDSLERSMCEAEGKHEDGDIINCAEYQRESKLNYYPINVEKLNMLVNADAEAFEFCNNEIYHNDDDCPYEYNIRTIPGDLVSVNGSVIATFNNENDEKDNNIRHLTVETYLEAAGIHDLDEDTLR